MIKKYSIRMCLAGICLFMLNAYAVPSSEVIFAKGSDCGHYKGDLTEGRVFTVEMNANQTLSVETGGHVQTVMDNQGAILADKGGANYRYETQSQGTHTIKMVGRANSQVDFCVS